MNKVILLGRLAKNPEMKQTTTGKSVANMVIAVNRTTKKEDGHYEADFIPLVAWENTAKFANNYLSKGSQILVEGKIQIRSYEAQDGSKRWSTEVMVSNIEFAGSKQNNQQPKAEDYSGGFGGSVEDEEIPF